MVGFKYVIVFGFFDDWFNLQFVKKVSSVLVMLLFLVLVYCDRGYIIFFGVLMDLVNKIKFQLDFVIKVDVKVFFDMIKVLGMDFNMDCIKEILVNIIGEEVKSEYILKLENELEEWYDFWFAVFIYKNWYIVGQIL